MQYDLIIYPYIYDAIRVIIQYYSNNIEELIFVAFSIFICLYFLNSYDVIYAEDCYWENVINVTQTVFTSCIQCWMMVWHWGITRNNFIYVIKNIPWPFLVVYIGIFFRALQ